MLGDREDAASAAGTVVDAVGHGLDLVCHRHDGDVSNEGYVVAGREVFPGLSDAIFLVELAQQLLEEGAHGVVVDAG